MKRSLLIGGLLVLIVFAGCAERTGTETENEQRPVGVPATFTLTGENISLTGSFTVERKVSAPFALRPAPMFPGDRRFLFIPDTQVENKTGILLLEGGEIRFTDGAFQPPTGEKITFNDRGAVVTVTEGDRRIQYDAAFPPSEDAADSAYFHGDAVTFSETSFTVEGYDRAALIHDNQSTEVTGPVTVTASGLVFGKGTQIQILEDSVSLSTKKFSTGGDITKGGATFTEENREINRARAVYGRDGDIRLTASRVETQGTTRVTQVLTPNGPAINATVSLSPVNTSVTVKSGQDTWVKVRYEETSRRGDAVLKNITVTGSGRGMVTVPLKKPAPITQQYVESIIGVSQEMPFFAVGLAATPALIFVDALKALGCALGECPSDHPFPVWIDAGSSGMFYYRVTGSASPGVYNATITVDGANYEPVSLPLAITVNTE